jgi:glutamate-1-semialdehyde 2,1-aminomutase
MDFTRSRALQKRSHALIPGGAHTYAKGDDQYPELAPGFIARGLGCHVFDVDGNEFIEYGMGLRAVGLGHAQPRVVAAAHAAMRAGTNFTRPAPIEVECAEALVDLIPGAEMVKFTKDGSTATSAAITLARAYTGRDRVAYCADHPFFSYNGWFIGNTPVGAGIPKAESELALGFRYNDPASLRALFERHPGEIAAVILEPARTDEPRDGFLEEVARLCRAHGALFVLDEMITGFRWHLRGAQTLYGVEPDLSTFGKALANGFAVSALVGKREFMRLGDLEHERERVFLLSTTHGAETHGLAAALETIRIYREEPVIETLYRQGERLRKGLEREIQAAGLGAQLEILGRPCGLVWTLRDAAGQPSQALRTLLLQETIRRGVLMPSLFVSCAHADADVDRTIEAVAESLPLIRRALEDGVERYLVGPPSQSVYRRFNRPR